MTQWTTVDEGWGRRAAEFATLASRPTPRVRGAAPGARRRRRRPVARPGLRERVRGGAGRGARGDVRRHRRLAPARRGGPRPRPGRRPARGRHARPAVGRQQLRRRHEFPRHLGHHARGARRGPPRAAARRPARADGVGPHQGLARRVGAAAVHPRDAGEGGQPGGDGAARPARRGRAVAGRHGFTDVRRVDIPFAWEFADPDHYARALAATGPAYEAIQAVGEDAFLDHARAAAAARVRDGLPLRAEILVVGYLARRPAEPVAGLATSRRAASSPPRRSPRPPSSCAPTTSPISATS